MWGAADVGDPAACSTSRPNARRTREPGSPPSQVAMRYFTELRLRVSRQLTRSDSEYARRQLQDYPWLYGALGAVAADVMFICENPSLRGVQRDHKSPVGGGEPDFESQWWGGPLDYAARRFRRVLCGVGLKTTPPDTKGGWGCYITNVVKEINVVRDQNALCARLRKQQAKVWAPILRWEIKRVRPKVIFCVGAKTARLVSWLQRKELLDTFHVNAIWHYSSRGSDSMVRRRMRHAITRGLRTSSLR